VKKTDQSRLYPVYTRKHTLSTHDILKATLEQT